MAYQPGEVTLLLCQWSAGDQQAQARLFELLLPELRKIAARFLRTERRGHTLQPTALLNEMYIRLVKAKKLELRDRGHFFAIAGRVMRHILIDYARHRPDFQFISVEGLPERIAGRRSQAELTMTIDHLLDKLELEDPQKRSIVELKFFLGLTDEETAEILNLPPRTLQHKWYWARRWLFQQLSEEP